MNHFSFDIKERVREAVDIVEFVSRYMPLRRSGRHYVGKCPWHDDSRPSLQINAERQSYKCWVCNLGGDIFSFVMQMEGVEFREALEILADYAGIEIARSTKDFQYTNPEKNSDNASSIKNESSTQNPITKKTLYQALNWTAQKYHEYFLSGQEAEIARNYLQERGINHESLKKFRIGFAPLQKDWIIKQAGGNPDRVKVLELIGNLARYEDENQNSPPSAPYDRFRGRLLFPIVDTQDRIVAFGGRILPNSPLQSRAKYVNSPETPVFSKHKMLYGLDIARFAMRKTHRALIMEGYTDVIIAHQFGFEDAVAVLGTALGLDHIKILKRFVEKMVLVLDGDEAGRKRADEVLELFVSQGADIEILTLPGGKDPCEFLLDHGSEAFGELLERGTVDALEHAFSSATRGVDIDRNVVGATRSLDKILGIIALAPARSNPSDPQRIRLEKTIQRLSERFGLPEKEVRNRLRQLQDQKQIHVTLRPDATMHPEMMHHESSSLSSAAVALEYVGSDDETIPDEIYSMKPGESMKSEESGASGGGGGSVWKTPHIAPLPKIPWDLAGIMPDGLEKDLIEIWLSDPMVFDVFREKILGERLVSPVTQLIYQVCCEFSDRGEQPTFERLMTRFDDPKMKSFLVERDEAAAEKQLAVTDRLIMEIVDGFERRHLERSKPKEIGKLRTGSLSSEQKMSLLLEIQQKQRARHGITEPKDG